MKPGKANTRRLTARGAAMRERIVSAAADLVWAQGAGETSLDDVMEKSGASKSQLYHYFADKDALLREAAALQTKRVLARTGNAEPLTSTRCAVAGRGPCAEQSGRLPSGRACLPVAAERQTRANSRRRRVRDVAHEGGVVSERRSLIKVYHRFCAGPGVRSCLRTLANGN